MKTGCNRKRVGLGWFVMIGLWSLPAWAQQWSDQSLTLLHGHHYRVDYRKGDNDHERAVLTFEHASGYQWGDLFAFLDRLESSRGNIEYYGELSPRLRLGSVRDHFISGFYLASTLEVSRFDADPGRDRDFANLLYGVGVDLDLPGFKFVQLNAYRADNENEADDWQLTVSFAVPFRLGESRWLYDGFIDYSSAEGDHAASLNATTQLKWDAGAVWGAPGQLYLGVEYVYWNNKFGIPHNQYGFGTDERNVNALLKWHW